MPITVKPLDPEVLTLARADRARYLAALSGPVACRPALLALLAFDAEITRIPQMVSEPMMGRIRLQWWLDELPGITGGRAPGHPVAQALAPISVDTQALQALVEARNFDFDGDFTAASEVLAYAQATGGALQALVLAQLGVDDLAANAAARDLGAALTLVNLGHDAQARDLLRNAREHTLAQDVKKAALPTLLLARLVDRRLRLGPRANEGAGAVFSVWWGILTGRY